MKKLKQFLNKKIEITFTEFIIYISMAVFISKIIN